MRGESYFGNVVGMFCPLGNTALLISSSVILLAMK